MHLNHFGPLGPNEPTAADTGRMVRAEAHRLANSCFSSQVLATLSVRGIFYRQKRQSGMELSSLRRISDNFSVSWRKTSGRLPSLRDLDNSHQVRAPGSLGALGSLGSPGSKNGPRPSGQRRIFHQVRQGKLHGDPGLHNAQGVATVATLTSIAGCV